MRILDRIGSVRPSDDGFSFRAQYQLVALLVWISGSMFMFHSLKYWHPWHYSNIRSVLPILHFLPWVVALTERRRETRRLLTDVCSSSCSIAFQRVLVRSLWSTYLVLFIIEQSLS
jgi:hypothetical protein